MRVKTILITEDVLLFAIGGTLFRQAPNGQPRKVENIMQKARDNFRSKAYSKYEWYVYGVPEEDLTSFIKDLLWDIPEFQELNLSQEEFEIGVKVDDDSRGRYTLISSYDKETKENWRREFIDLDACIRNIKQELIKQDNFSRDCFDCKYSTQESYKQDTKENKCTTCSINPKLYNNYEGNRRPKGIYTFACKYDCSKGWYICCEECPNKNDCEDRCKSKSQTCGLSINHKRLNRIPPIVGVDLAQGKDSTVFTVVEPKVRKQF